MVPDSVGPVAKYSTSRGKKEAERRNLTFEFRVSPQKHPKKLERAEALSTLASARPVYRMISGSSVS